MNTETFMREILRTDMAGTTTLQAMLGPYIGGGSERWVFHHPEFPGKRVIKISVQWTTQSTNEYQTWLAVKHTKWAKWFAPCYRCSATGQILTMAYAKPLDTKPRSQIPKKIPAIFYDVKDDAFGWIGNQFVCVDYGLTAYENIYHSMKLIKNGLLS